MRVAIHDFVGLGVVIRRVERGQDNALRSDSYRQSCEIRRCPHRREGIARAGYTHPGRDKDGGQRRPLSVVHPVVRRETAGARRPPDRISTKVADVGEVGEAREPGPVGTFRLLAVIPDGHTARLDAGEGPQLRLAAHCLRGTGQPLGHRGRRRGLCGAGDGGAINNAAAKGENDEEVNHRRPPSSLVSARRPESACHCEPRCTWIADGTDDWRRSVPGNAPSSPRPVLQRTPA